MRDLLEGSGRAMPFPRARARPASERPSAAPFQVPRVTLCYAQSLDGSVAACAGKRTAISGPESLQHVHRLRAAHDGIVVGVGTVLADDPRLTVRRVPGKHPQPIVLDTALRFPPEAYLIARHPLGPWIIAGPAAERSRQERLEAAGARVFRLPLDESGGVSLPELLGFLGRAGLRKVMVEGGARTITSFLCAHLVDRMVVAISPMVLGGLPAFHPAGGGRLLVRLRRVSARRMGEDVVIEGVPDWEDA